MSGLTVAADVRATCTDQSSNTTTYTLDPFGNPLTVTDALGNMTTYTRNDNSQVTEVVQPAVVNGTSTAAPTTVYGYDSDGNLHTERSPDGSTRTWTYTSYSTYGGDFDEVTEYTDGVGNETAYSYDTSTGDLLTTDQYANGTSPDDEGQGTGPETSDPITTDVYTQYSGSDSAPPAGLVASETDPDGFVSGTTYDPAGSPTGRLSGPDDRSGPSGVQRRGHRPPGPSATWPQRRGQFRNLRQWHDQRNVPGLSRLGRRRPWNDRG